MWQAMRQGTIVTDSQYVVQMFRAVKEHPDPLRFWNAPNYDLLQVLCAALAPMTPRMFPSTRARATRKENTRMRGSATDWRTKPPEPPD